MTDFKTTLSTITLRPEIVADFDAREALLDRAFGPARFEKTCERIREGRLPARGLAFTAADGDRVIGTVRLWNVCAGPGRPALVLGPLAVDCDYRSEGLGAQLMQHALREAAALGHSAVLLVGDAPYYARFGFSGDMTRNLWMPGPVERERFLALELKAGALSGAFGLVSPTGEKAARPDLRALLATIEMEERRAA